jgi:pyruvate kinase
MVARGDLGIEVGYAELTGLQKQIIEETRRHDRVTITATQMMESMIHESDADARRSLGRRQRGDRRQRRRDALG